MYSDFVRQRIHIPFYSNLQTTSLGMDSVEYCRNRKLFDQYPQVTYQFNELGFRTHNVDCFDPHAILVLGDSFTLGLGVNSKDRYSDIIEQTLNHQVLNFSLNGASNDWISRKLEQLLTYFTPRAIILHYTFSHRRERPNSDWFDDERTECEPFYSCQENFDNWYNNFNNICNMYQGPLIHSFIPNWHTQSVNYAGLGNNILLPVQQIDQARDNFHYGTNTHQLLAKKITNLLACELRQFLSP
jgi:hypothetical protein